jgi:predicted nucleic acid-binding protein
MLIVDSNVLIDVFENDPEWADWSVARLREQSLIRELTINPVIYAELSLAFSSIEKLDAALEGLSLRLEQIPRPALFLAGRAFLQYKRKGGSKNNVLSDFFIGAHATVLGWPLLTRDASRYRAYFPTLDLISP